MTITYEYRTVEYHSHAWQLLVETGWLTMTVDTHASLPFLKVATMIREAR